MGMDEAIAMGMETDMGVVTVTEEDIEINRVIE
jgi:hypothetical protein